MIDIETARKRKADLERNIEVAMRAFEAETGLKIAAVCYDLVTVEQVGMVCKPRLEVSL